MNNLTYCQTMAEYNQWMNQNLYAICAEIPDAQRREDRGAFFRSVHGTLNHLLVGDRIWMGRFTGTPFVAQVSDELYHDFSELQEQRQLTDRQILDWAQQLPPDWLEQPLTYTSAVGNVTRSLPRWLLVTHMFNHQTHHRGQLTTLLYQMGHDPGVTDLPWLPRFRPAQET
jgi:uncharacterized damage-inducible protein DinB